MNTWPTVTTVDPWWRDRAGCRGTDTELFFDDALVDDALAVCSRCPVVADCLADARRMEAGWSFAQRHGVRGGTTPRGRAELDGQPIPRRKTAPKPKRPPRPRKESRPATPRVRARATHCKRGHELAGANLLLTADGKRRCRACRNEWQRARRTARTALSTADAGADILAPAPPLAA